MLYWFRTPPGVKVGRAALDEDAIRLIEQLNPDMEFDWPKILKGQGSLATEPRVPFDVRRQRTDGRRPLPPPRSPRSGQPPPAVEPARPGPEKASPGEAAADAVPAPVREPVETLPTTFIAPREDDAATPAHAKLGAEGILRLRLRYAELLTQISERVPDETRRAELKQQADRLNPDSWVTEDQVREALEQYESVLAALREVVGQKRRRRRGPDPRPAEPDESRSQAVDQGNAAGGPGNPGEVDVRDSPRDADGRDDGNEGSPGES